MVFVSDMNSIFVAARILGCAIHVVIKNDLRARRRRDVFFIVFSMLAYLCTQVIMYGYVLTYQQIDSKGLLFTFMRVSLFYLCFFTDATLTTLWNSKIRLVLSQLRDFDRVTKFRDEISISRCCTVRNICRIVVFFTLIYWSIIGYISYRIETRLPIFRGSMYVIVDSAVSMQILVFVGISFLIEERFRQLCRILTFTAAKGKLIVSDGSNSRFTLQQIWWLHSSLVNAIEVLNSVYTIQLLLWISSMSVNAMSRIYTLYANQLSDFEKVRELMMTVVFAWHLILITSACHMTAYQANRVGEIIFEPCSSASMKRVFLQENLEAAAYFQLRKIHFSAIAGFVHVDLSLLLSIVSAMTTYLVILR